MAVLTTAIDRALDKRFVGSPLGIIADGHNGFVGHGQRFKELEISSLVFKIFPDIGMICLRNIVPICSFTCLIVRIRTIIGHHSHGLILLISIRESTRSDALTGTKDMAFEVGHRHSGIGADDSIASDGDSTDTTAYQSKRHSHRQPRRSFTGIRRILDLKPSHRGNLATAIDVVLDLGIALHGDGAVATHQGRVAMGLDACTCSEHVVQDDGCACPSLNCGCCKSYRHLRAPFHTGYLTATIDIASQRLQRLGSLCSFKGSHRAVADDDIRVADHHGFITLEHVCNTLATAIDIATDGDTSSAYCDTLPYIVTAFGHLLGAYVHMGIIIEAIRVIFFSVIIQVAYIGQFAATIDVTSDVSTCYGDILIFSCCCIILICRSCISKMCRFCGHLYSRFRTNIHRCIAVNIGCITAAEYIDNFT